MLSVFAIGCLIVVSRRPDALINPQFFAEDGTIWYAQAHDVGWRSLFSPFHRGYFDTAERLVGLASLLIPMLWAPLLFNLIAVAVEALPAIVIASGRYADVVPSRLGRLFLALLYVALPATWGAIANLTHAQWHLAMLACVVVLASPGRSTAWNLFDISAVALSGLTGPTCLLLAPIAAAVWWRRRDHWAAILAIVTIASAGIQGASLFFSAPPLETHVPLGPSLMGFLRLLSWRVTYAALLGQHITGPLTGLWGDAWALLGAAGGLAALTYAIVRGPLELRLLIAFGALVMGSALLWPVPMNAAPNGYWASLAAPGAHVRYFFPLTFALIVSFVWLLTRPSTAMRTLGALCLAAVLVIAIPADWREPAYRDYHFAAYVGQYERAPIGSRVQIPIPPGWSMIITKP